MDTTIGKAWGASFHNLSNIRLHSPDTRPAIPRLHHAPVTIDRNVSDLGSYQRRLGLDVKISMWYPC